MPPSARTFLNQSARILTRDLRPRQGQVSWWARSLMSTERTSHLERTAQEPRDEGLHNVTLSRIDQINEGVRLLRLSLDSGPVKFSPGQWLDTFVPGVPRAGGFTITSPPSVASDLDAPYLELAIQDSPSNPPAAWLWRPESDILGSTLRVRIGGSFIFPPPTMPLEKIRRVVFVAGGVGINPLMSMLSFAAEQKHGMDVRVLYASKMPRGGLREVLFAERIAGLFEKGTLKGGFQMFLTNVPEDQELSIMKGEGDRGSHKAALDVRTGRLTLDDLEEAIGGGSCESTLVYVCGPPTMTDEIVGVLTSTESMKLAKQQVMTEKWW